jgi:GT2 family glycosyltransferase
MSGLQRGAVAIGRNEGNRLRRCIESLRARFDPIVYVDSGSSDGSVERVRELGLEVVELDMSLPFSAGRARNAGFERIKELRMEVDWVQFIDGDCELDRAWPDRAEEVLRADPGLAIVCGRRRERSPEASIFNTLCDLEWDGPVGNVRACGGDFMARATAFEEVGGFDPAFVAGEEPELCLRLRQQGWRIERLADEMTLHDAAMFRVGQWWQRAQRTGHAYAQTLHKHGLADDRKLIRSVRSIVLWAGLLPVAAGVGIPPTGGWSLLLLLAWPFQVARVFLMQRRRGRGVRPALAYAISVVAGKFAQMHGLLRYVRNRLLDRPATLIEYKGPDSSVSTRG